MEGESGRPRARGNTKKYGVPHSHGAGVRGITYGPHGAPRHACAASAGPRRTPSPDALLYLRPARQDAEEVAEVLGEDLPEGRASEPGAVGGWRALRPRPVDALSPRAASAVRLLLAACWPASHWHSGGYG